MWDGFDKRKFPRLTHSCSITIYIDNAVEPIHAFTENIGAGGVCVILKEDLQKLSMCKVKLKLNDQLPEIKTLARVAWNVQTQRKEFGRGKVFDTGIEFVSIEPALQAMIQSFVERALKKG